MTEAQAIAKAWRMMADAYATSVMTFRDLRVTSLRTPLITERIAKIMRETLHVDSQISHADYLECYKDNFLRADYCELQAIIADSGGI